MIVPDATATTEALGELHRARRRNHRQNIHWVDAMYRVYLTGLVAIVGTLILAGQFPQQTLDEAGRTDLVTRGPGWLGLGVALAVFVGLRSGGRGGPLTLEAASVQHELLAPVDRTAALRQPARKQLRTLAYGGAVAGAIIGLLGARQTNANQAESVVLGALTIALAVTWAAGAAMVISGRRLGIWVANIVGLALLAWSITDIALQSTTSPASLLAALMFWPIKAQPLAVIGVAVAAVTIVVGLLVVGGLSLEQARRRAGLVSQLRFAVTLQDVRTVVLLRRQLAQERPRAEPWIRLRRGHGKLPPTWRRDWQSYLRFPLVRVVRMVVLGVAAGVAIGFTWRGVMPAFLLGALALYLAGYDAVEPIAQEVDHPTRWDAIPENQGRLLLQHLPAALVVMLVVCGVTVATTLLFVPATVVAALAPILVLPVAAAAAVAAGVSTAMGAPNPAKMLDEFGADMMGFVQMIRLIVPPAVVAAAMAPMLAAGSDAAAPNTAKVSNLFIWPLLLIAGSMAYLMARRPSRL